MKTPVRTPVVPHPVDPRSPRPHPGPPRPTPPPQPRPRFVFAAALCISIGLALIGAGLVLEVGGEDRRLMPTDRIAVPVLLALFLLFSVVSLALAPRAPRHRPAAVGAGKGAAAVLRGAAAVPTD